MSTYGNWKCCLTFILVLATPIGTLAQRAAKSDEAAIRENVGYMQEGWNTKSGALFAKPFAEDADYVVINGMHIKTQKVIEQSHQEIFDTFYKNSVINLSVKQIRFLRSDVALVHVKGLNQTRQGETTKETETMLSMVMLKEAGKWKIVSFQNTEIINRQSK